MTPQCRLDTLAVGILSNLLELIDSHQARTVGGVEITKDFLKGCRRINMLSKTDAPHRITAKVKRDLLLKRFQSNKEALHHFAPQWFKLFKNRLSKYTHKLSKRIGRVDIYNESVVLRFYLGKAKTMMYQVGFAKPTRCNKCHIVLIGEQFHQIGCLFLSIAKILRACIASCNKGIYHNHHFYYWRKVKQKFSIIKVLIIIKVIIIFMIITFMITAGYRRYHFFDFTKCVTQNV